MALLEDLAGRKLLEMGDLAECRSGRARKRAAERPVPDLAMLAIAPCPHARIWSQALHDVRIGGSVFYLKRPRSPHFNPSLGELDRPALDLDQLSRLERRARHSRKGEHPAEGVAEEADCDLVSALA